MDIEYVMKNPHWCPYKKPVSTVEQRVASFLAGHFIWFCLFGLQLTTISIQWRWSMLRRFRIPHGRRDLKSTWYVARRLGFCLDYLTTSSQRRHGCDLKAIVDTSYTGWAQGSCKKADTTTTAALTTNSSAISIQHSSKNIREKHSDICKNISALLEKCILSVSFHMQMQKKKKKAVHSIGGSEVTHKGPQKRSFILIKKYIGTGSELKKGFRIKLFCFRN